MKIGLGIGLGYSKESGGGAVAPVNTIAPVISGTTTLGSTLTSTTGTWTGSPAPAFTYQWYRGATLISGATSSTYVTVLADSTASITCRVTGTNTAGSAVAISNALTMDNYAPVNSVAPVISGTAVVGQVLTTTDGTWSNSPSSFSYQWKRGATNIGTNASTYTLVAADAGNTSNITCVVTATNASGSANATSNQIAQILTVRTSAFLTASAISDATIRGGLNTFDIGLIANSLDTKIKALYPFVSDGATSNDRALQHRWNFMDARNLDAAFRLLFTGGWDHTATGALPNGSNTFANTYFNVLNNTTGFSQHYCMYSRTQNTSINGMQMGAFDGTSETTLYQYYNVISVKGGSCYLYPNTAVTINNNNTRGLQIISRTANNVLKLFFNGSLLATNTNTETLTRPNRTMYLGASNWSSGATQYSPHEHAFASIGDGLTDTDATNLYNLTQALQTTLGRQV